MVIDDKLAVLKNKVWGVGRGVLHFSEGWYRKPRSNLGDFGGFYAVLVSGGVDII